jgi:hypothetical protein
VAAVGNEGKCRILVADKGTGKFSITYGEFALTKYSSLTSKQILF